MNGSARNTWSPSLLCTTALHVAVLLAGLKPEDEVIVPSYTFVATANSLLFAGVTPVYGEIDAKTYNLDPDKLASLLTPRTKAVLTVDQFGLPCDLDRLEAFCNKNNLKLIEDAACAFGAIYKKRKIGSQGKFITLSFHPRKSITTGEGGAFVTDDADLAEQAKLLRSHGVSVSDLQRHASKGTTYESYVRLGYNYRLSDVQAAIGLAQLPKAETIFKRRQELAVRYAEKLKAIGWINPPFVPEGIEHPYQTYAAILEPTAPMKRDELVQFLARKEISSRRGIPPIHKEPYIKDYVKNLPMLPVTDHVSQQTLILPMYPQMTEQEQDIVIEGLKSAEREPGPK